MGFTINQVKHFYCVKAVKDKVQDLKEIGDAVVRFNKKRQSMYVQYKGPGGIITSDDIPVNTVTNFVHTKADKLAYPLKRQSLQLNPELSDIAYGQDYIVRLAFRQFIGLSEEDQYFKYGVIRPTKNMDVSTFYKNLAIDLARNTDVTQATTPLVNVYLVAEDDTETLVTGQNYKTLDNSVKYKSIILEEAIQDWVLGTMPEAYIPFSVQTEPVEYDGLEVQWGLVEQIKPKTFVPNGHVIADMEYMFMGARGDFYRNMGYPNVIKTTYVVNPDLSYDTLDMHFNYTGAGENPQKSEKDIIFVSSDTAVLTKLIANIKTVTGLELSK